MTELQFSLVATGAVIVLGVLAYNQWQLRRNRQRQQYLDEMEAGNVRMEPTLSMEEGEADLAADMADQAGNMKPAGQAGHKRRDPGLASIQASPVIDPLIDCVVPIRLETPVAGEKVLALAAPLRRAGLKPMHLEGRQGAEAEWEPLRSGSAYDALQIAVQLANRGGALNALEFSEFMAALHQLAEGLDAYAAHVEFPDMNETVANARELDAFAAQCDAQLGINVISDGAPWSAAYVQTMAGQDGLVLSRDGTRFTKFQEISAVVPDKAETADSDAPPAEPVGALTSIPQPLFTLQFATTNFLRDDLTAHTGNRITLLLEVPNAPEALAPFRRMWEYAQTLASRMGARVVDDNLQPLPEAAITGIEKQLQGLYQHLEARGIPAGSTVAKRLFSLSGTP